MHRIFAACVEALAAAVILLPLLLLINAVYWHNPKKTAGYALFSLYLAAMFALVGLPGVGNFHLELNLNPVPFAGMAADAENAALNVLLFVPLGVFLPLLWPDMRRVGRTALCGLTFSLLIEILQIFTFRASDINDLLTNTLGAVIGFGIASAAFDRKLPEGTHGELYLLFGLVLAVMIFIQPLLSGLLWRLVL